MLQTTRSFSFYCVILGAVILMVFAEPRTHARTIAG